MNERLNPAKKLTLLSAPKNYEGAMEDFKSALAWLKQEGLDANPNCFGVVRPPKNSKIGRFEEEQLKAARADPNWTIEVELITGERVIYERVSKQRPDWAKEFREKNANEQ